MFDFVCVRCKRTFLEASAALAFILLLLLASQAAAQESTAREEGVVYCEHDGVPLGMDLEYPNDLKVAHPALVFLCGNAWGHWWGYGFDRHQYSNVIRMAAAHGYVAATVDYRPTSIREGGKSKYTYPAQLLDVRSAVRWLRANAAKYGIDVDHIGAIGFSSGGHLALMLGLLDTADGPNEKDNLQFTSKVQAVVSLAGPTELALMYEEATYPAMDAILREFMGGTPEDLPTKYREASPLYHITREAAPVLIVHSDNDPEIPVGQSTLFAEEMKKAGASVTLIIQEGMGHINAYDHEAIYPFLDRVLKRTK